MPSLPLFIAHILCTSLEPRPPFKGVRGGWREGGFEGYYTHTPWGNSYSSSISLVPRSLHEERVLARRYCVHVAGNFEGENFHEFCDFVVFTKVFSAKFGGCGTFGTAKA